MGQRHTMNQEAVLGELEFKLLNDYQKDFPLVAHPFAELAQHLDVEEATVISTLQSMQQRGLVSRIGAVFRPNVVGVSALAALAVPPARLEEVAARVSARIEVNHNYQREHHLNLWFVATASSVAHLHAVFQALERDCGCGPVLVLPLLEQFHIDLGFGLACAASPHFQSEISVPAEVLAIELSEPERALMAILQTGLPLVAQPFAALGCAEADAIALLARWTTSGVIKRFGVVVRHHELGYTANAMVVWNVPDAVVSQVGTRLASSGRVSLCYRRPRALPHWPYNLFCMVHGKNRQEVEQRIATLVRTCGLDSYPHEILFSCRRFKQCGARYVPDTVNETLPELAHGPD
ncbi:Lrp/AsnC family transcriptional regulator [Rhodoferax ferrireducens]|uniref:siroheme decarboxylase subunit beta n=1 Tax=Rhodoferax ferrireducens TaxID=192843 RepID=UPI0018E588AB|nr:Lrp/AsnC family transcriptional regulator [Rhodoferax ferrireducens]